MDMYHDLNQKTAYLATALNTYFSQKQLPLQIFYFGSLFRFDYQGDIDILFYYLLKNGLYIWEGRILFLSMAHTDEDIETIIQIVKQSIEEMQTNFFFTQYQKETRTQEGTTLLMGGRVKK